MYTRFAQILRATAAPALASCLVGTAAVAGVSVADKGPETQCFAWGWGGYGQLGHGEEHDVATVKPVEFLNDKRIVQLVSSGSSVSTAAVSADGDVYTFGCGKDNRLGHGAHTDAPNQDIPRLVHTLSARVVRAAVGEYHMACIDTDGQVWTWGKARAGQLGHDNAQRGYPNRVATLPGQAVDVSCGRQHTVAVMKNGDVYSWGHGYEGALGHSSRDAVRAPKKVDALSGKGAVAVVCGREHTLVLCSSGDVYAFGCDDSGQLGLGFESRYQRTPVLVGALKGKQVVKVLAGDSHSIAILADGTALSWGGGANGQLGHGDKSDLGIPRRIQALKHTQVVDGAAGGGHTILVTADNRVWVFGRGRNGQLGRGDHLESIAAYRTEPQEIEALARPRVLAVSAGSDHSLALVQTDTE